MTDRVHQHLDGEAADSALSAPERARLDALRRAVDAAAAQLRAASAPDLAARVMAALPAQAPSRDSGLRTAWRWLWQARPLRLAFRPAYALAGGCMAVAAAAVALPRTDDAPAAPVAQAPAPAATAKPIIYVQFRFEAADARQVALAGTFTGWQPTLQLRETEPGVWTALVPLRPGVHDYVFVVDGQRWTPDPNAPQQVDDSFGGTNSRLSLPELGASA
jgi:Glycogen recognition site of AMP-activated protein kinase